MRPAQIIQIQTVLVARAHVARAQTSRESWPAASVLAGLGGDVGHGSALGKRVICEDFLVEPTGGPPVS